MESIGLVCRSVIAVIVTAAAVAKLREGSPHASAVRVLVGSELLRAVGIHVVPLLELAVGLWLFSGLAPAAASASAAVLLLVFTGLLVRVRRGGRRSLSCNCFGRKRRGEESVDRLVVRNVVLAALALLASAAPTRTFSVPERLAAVGGAIGLMTIWVLLATVHTALTSAAISRSSS